jgi:zinc D-Ala-D-Ala carboxypeptidase
MPVRRVHPPARHASCSQSPNLARSTRFHRAAALVTALALAAASILVQPASTARAAAFDRLAGANRFETAAAISAAFYGSGTPVVYVARGDAFPDAVAAGPAAARDGGPILITYPHALPTVIADELRRLAPRRIVIIGGESAISPAVAQALSAFQTGGGVTRIGGIDRYQTAALVSESFPPGGAVYVSTGESFPDALAGGAAAARDGAPMLLTRRGELPRVTRAALDRLAPSRIVVLGGPGAISDAVATALGSYTAGGVQRLAGADRYGTSAAVARTFPDPQAAFLATGRNYPDALSAIPAAAGLGAPVVLTEGTEVPMRSDVEALFAELFPDSVHVVGGAGVVRNSVVLEVQAAIEGLPALPGCTYEDVLTPLTGLADWKATLVDTRLAVPSSYVPTDLVSTANAGLAAGYQIRSLVVPDLRAMVAAAAAAGAPLAIVSAYRSYATQADVFAYWVDQVGYEQALRTSARAGHSEHQLGTTLDFTSRGGADPWQYADWAQTPAGAWMAVNAWRYGFLMSYPANSFSVACYDYEPWHYRYVGRDVAGLVTESGLTPREWLWRQGYGVH